MRKLDLTVGACIVHGGKVLLLHHAKLDLWLFPGGHIDANETPDAAVVREVKEETGLDFRFLHSSRFVQTEGEMEVNALPFHSNVHSVGDHDHYCLYYLGTVDDPKYMGNHESKEIRWFTREEIEKLETVQSVKTMAVHALTQ